MAKRRKPGALVPAAQPNLPSATLSAGGRFDLTYKRIAGLRIEGKSFEMSLFTGAVLEDCHFQNVNFDRCDFAGTKFVNCTFDHCSLVPAEVRSCFLNSCKFNDCDLGGSQWAATQVERCTFLNCSLVSATIRETIYVETTFTRCDLKKGSITLNKFTSCQFDEIDLGDCTALFLFFDHCDFARSRFSTECVGYTYGLTRENLESSSLTYLGNPIRTQGNTQLVSMLLESYLDRHWYVGACALELNFRKLSPAHSLRLLTQRLEPDIAHNKRMDWDELQFLSTVLERLNEEGRLPLVGIWPVYRLVEGAYATLQAEFPQSRSFSSAPELVLRRLERLLNESINAIASMIPGTSNGVEALLLELHLDERPTYTLDELIPASLLNMFGASTGMTLVSSRAGSWIELWQLAASVFAAAQITLVAVNGMMGQLIKVGENSRKLSRVVLGTKPAKSITSSKKKAPRKKTNTGTELMLSAPATLSDQQSVLLERVAQITPSDLQKLDKLVMVVMNLPDARLEAFGDYAGAHLQSAQLRTAPSAKRKR